MSEPIDYTEHENEFYYYHEDQWWVVVEQDEQGLTTGAQVDEPWTLH